MLSLKRVRLVNWHYFHDSVLELDRLTLIAGDNGSGKSTIIDAIQYALIADIRKIKFNAAAAGTRTERTLESYCRCKIGATELAYYRGDTITHVILEFANAETTFLAGVMVEAYATSETRESFWILEKGEIEDIEVYQGQTMIQPRSFREDIKRLGGTISPTKKDYSNRLTHLLKVHRRNVSFNPYFEALIRSVSFVPLTSVDTFVCEYILEERQVDISAMKENLLNYREAEKEAVLMEEKIDELEKIETLQENVRQLVGQILNQEYLERRLKTDICELNRQENMRQHDRTKTEYNLLLENIRDDEGRIARLQARLDEMNAALGSSDAHRMFLHYTREREDLERKLRDEDARIKRFDSLKKQCEALSGRALSDDPDEDIRGIESERDEAIRKHTQHESVIEQLEKERADLKSEENDLARGIIRYPESTVELKRELNKKGIDAWVTADLIEVTHTEWQNAVEGWLNTQRFNIIVEEQNFQRALEVYDSLPRKIAGVGIPNIATMKDSEIRPGSLAEMVEASSPLARRYCAFLLGDVMTANLDTLKTFSRAITRDCMKYSGKTALRISETIYSRWYIGKAAKEKRLEAIRGRLGDLESEIEGVRADIRRLKESAETSGRAVSLLYELKTLIDAFEKKNRLAEDLVGVNAQLDSIDTSEFEDLKRNIESLRGQIDGIRHQIDEQNKESGRLEHAMQQLDQILQTLTAELEKYSLDLDQFTESRAELSEEFQQFYNRHVKKQTSLPEMQNKLMNIESSKKGLKTKLRDRSDELRGNKEQYNRRYNTYMTVEGDDSTEFIMTLRRFQNTELPLYREKIGRAREEAEQQFREHFVSRLNEYLTDAKESFTELNHILKKLKFGQDQYSFSLQARSEKKKLLEVIADAARIREFEGTLFEQFEDEEQRRSIERLFDSILENDLESEEVYDICDYRTYFTYDIRIKHTGTLDESTGKPLESSLNKSLREKSGGETQTPYYVAIAASFYRFFKDEENAVRLVLFDEAFNKMDDDRIGNMLSFFKKMNIQVLTAVPTEKIETIAPHADRINLVLRKDYQAFIRDYRVLEEAGVSMKRHGSR